MVSGRICIFHRSLLLVEVPLFYFLKQNMGDDVKTWNTSDLEIKALNTQLQIAANIFFFLKAVSAHH